MTITYRTVQGTTTRGIVLDTHPQTGELLVTAPDGRRAWVPTNRLTPQETA
jgi:hypothetical protein